MIIALLTICSIRIFVIKESGVAVNIPVAGITMPKTSSIVDGIITDAKGANPVLWLSAGLIALFSGLTILFPATASDYLAGAKAWTLNQFDWLFALTPIVALFVCITLAVSPFGRIRIGGARAKPEFHHLSWSAMLSAILTTNIRTGALADIHRLRPRPKAATASHSRFAM